jgi:hypothetical protein
MLQRLQQRQAGGCCGWAPASGAAAAAGAQGPAGSAAAGWVQAQPAPPQVPGLQMHQASGSSGSTLPGPPQRAGSAGSSGCGRGSERERLLGSGRGCREEAGARRRLAAPPGGQAARLAAQPACSTAATASSTQQQQQQPVALPSSEEAWAAVIGRACERGEVDCAVCLGPLARRGGQAVAALSCSHIFHVHCIAAFEMCRGGVASCPVCRQGCSRREFAASVGASSGDE